MINFLTILLKKTSEVLETSDVYFNLYKLYLNKLNIAILAINYI
jgi:hypothetical protein